MLDKYMEGSWLAIFSMCLKRLLTVEPENIGIIYIGENNGRSCFQT